MSDAESGSELAETDSQRPDRMPKSTLSSGLKRGGVQAAKVSPPGLLWTCPPVPSVQGQRWSPVPPCGGAGNRLPQPPLGTLLKGLWPGPTGQVTDPAFSLHPPTSFFFSPFLPFCFSSVLGVDVCVHTHSSHQHRCAGSLCPRACPLVYTCHLCCSHALTPPFCAAMLSIL